MVKFEQTSEGKRATISISNMCDKFRSACRDGLYEAGRIAKDTASQGMLYSKKSGRFYKYKRVLKQASAPGEYSANRSGTGRKSIDFQVEGFRRMVFGAGVLYMKWQEDGTVNMGARENLGQAVRQSSQEVLTYLKRRLDIELKRG